MKLKIKTVVLLFLLASTFSYGQMEQYSHKREIKGVSEQWHKIVLPNEIFAKVSQNLSDIRIFGITANNDTVEAPYILQHREDKIFTKELAFESINTSYNNKGYFLTFKISASEAINQIALNFEQQNFDWQLKLEGSQNQQEWFTVVDNYRILSIKNELTDFHFSTLTFPSSTFRFYRLFINSKEKPDLKSASIVQQNRVDGVFRDCPIKNMVTKENKQTKQTEIDIELQIPVPVSYFKIAVTDSFDYYRPVTIKYLSDSLKTEKGWKYNFHTLASGTLNSLEVNDFKISAKTVRKLKILIHNQDNQPLNIDTILIKQYIHELDARFTETATYFLTYGNERVNKVHYDIDRFKNKVPQKLIALELGNEQTIAKMDTPDTEPLFKNKIWLWLIMTVIMIVLGWFSVEMVRKN